ncbi:hypothetical protein NPS58_13010 [Pseudomonas putida]|uniref:hypothetical protein n=1 Tax=Pseudomonas putida TaxID=303 RepID=UPI0023636750|nr:hypothetical protein [Pseudomonas putida]MDD2058345.1 hypothetical protein [Pseudomonas putida]
MENLSARMVEDAYRYLRGAKQLLRGDDLMDVAQINAALGMEILLKSFVAVPNSNLGTLWETYELDKPMIKAAYEQLKAAGNAGDRIDWHDLLMLFHAIPESIRRSVGLHRHVDEIESNRYVFTNARYRYEKNARQWYCTGLVGVLQDVIPRIVEYHKQQGSKDPFIQSFQKSAGPIVV